MNVKKSEFWFDLPQEQIAQTPIEPRDHSRLLVMDRQSGACSHHHFYDIIDYLNPGDLLVVNDSRVIPARLYGIKPDTGGHIEVLLLEQKEKDVWEALVKPGKKAKPGVKLTFGDGLMTGEVLETVEGGNRLIRFSYEGESIYPVLEQIGNMPLPPYITAKLEDNERYQTVYSHELGSAAAPTAGLHFTNELLDKIRAKGVNIATVTLHVGLGTFRPVKEDEITEHKMHSEHYYLPQETADLINQTKANGKRVIAVGTTSCRTLEAVAARYAEEGAERIRCDKAACAALGVEVVERPVATVESGFVRHSSAALARELILLHAERSVRIAGARFRPREDAYRMEERK